MENKYYTPEISDIRVGYECEINSSLGYSKEFTPTIVGFKNEDYAYTDEVSRLINMMDDGYGEIRTPYLTKEQIEAEGWTSFDGIAYKKQDFTLVFGGTGNGPALISIIIYTGSRSFCGEVKSINEFRTICKLLNIK